MDHRDEPGGDDHREVGRGENGKSARHWRDLLPRADTKALADWYETHLGVPGFWGQEAGMTVFAPFKESTDYFPADKQWMINFRVDDLDGMIAQLKAADIAVETRPDEWDTPETGRFARIHDPEGNQIELWEPPAQQ